ncbi:MAG: hypothetical protein AB2L14_24720 [Candidatus Xenobiia bacterium LiM19]
MESIKGFGYTSPVLTGTPMAGPSGTTENQNAAPEEKLSITQKQLGDLEAKVARDMEELNQAQHKYSSAHTWGDRFGSISAKAARLSLPTFIASIVTSVAAGFLAIPALGTLAGIASVACMATGATWLGTLGAEKLCEHIEKKAEKNLPELTMKVQTENKELVGLQNQVQRLKKQTGQNNNAAQSTAPPPQKPSAGPAAGTSAAVSAPADKPVEKSGDKQVNTAPDDEDEEKKPAQNLDVTDSDGFIDIGGISIKKND